MRRPAVCRHIEADDYVPTGAVADVLIELSSAGLTRAIDVGRTHRPSCIFDPDGAGPPIAPQRAPRLLREKTVPSTRIIPSGCHHPNTCLDAHLEPPYIYRTKEAAMGGRTARIELRAEVERERRIRYAAELSQQSVSAFVLDAASQRAEQIIAASAATIVPSDWFDGLWAALEEPPAANAALRARAARSRRVAQR